ncbi:MAG TPA: tyrosine-type recombinase/integrase [Paludibacteraceae bacterium]|nr:tyrosine-type recombinase/integrase [Paludibacteraceae bacterium]
MPIRTIMEINNIYAMNANDYLIKFETEMRLINYCNRTIANYISHTRIFLLHFDKDPHEINEDEIKEYLKKSSSQAQLKQRIGSIKLFYEKVIHDPLKFKYIQYPRREQTLPDVLSQDEMRRLFAACSNLKHLTILQLFYSTGMRESEVINLRVTDIDSNRMVIHIRQAKGKKDRLVPLSERTLITLRQYYQSYKPKEYLFNGQFSLQYSAKSIQQFIHDYAAKAGITRRVYPHLIRHCFATHLYEGGADINLIQALLGHKSVKTTMIYTHLSNRLISQVRTPDMVL